MMYFMTRLTLLHKLIFILAFNIVVSGVTYAQDLGRDTLSVTEPNGFANINVTDLSLKSTVGEVNLSRRWDGREWRFNPHWESLSNSFTNMTGSSSADDQSAPTNAGSGAVSSSANNAGTRGAGCWVWVDEDWQPSKGETWIGGDGQQYTGAAPLTPLRSTPFNKVIADGDDSSSYTPMTRVTVDYASLCGGVGKGVENTQAVRRQNELYLGENSRFAFNNRSFLEKLDIATPDTPTKDSLYNQLQSGKVTINTQAKSGYRWYDKSGDWINYNVQGQVISWGDKNDNSVWLLRSQDGKLRGVTDGKGIVQFSLHYDGDKLIKVQDYSQTGDTRASRSVNYSYDARNRLTEVTDVRGYTTTYTYDDGNRLTAITDPETRKTELAYQGNTIKQQTDPEGAVTDYQFDYDSSNKTFFSKTVLPETEAGRYVQENYHNRNGKLVKQIVNGLPQSEIRYDPANRSEHVTNARGYTTIITKDEFENVVGVTHPDGSKVTHKYSARHMGMTESTDEEGITTRYEHDDKGNLIKRIEAVGTQEARVTDYTRNDKGQMTAITYQGNGNTPDTTWRMTYDTKGNIADVTDPEGRQSKYQYDRMGNLTLYTDGNNHSSEFQYDNASNLTVEADPTGNAYKYSYNKSGDLTQVTDPKGNATNYSHDKLGRTTAITHAEGGSYRISYNGQGLPIKETDEDGRSVSTAYDNFLRLIQSKDGKDNITKYGYTLDNSGKLGALNSPTLTQYPTFKVESRYDRRERPTSETILNPTDGGVEGLIDSRKYDKRGLLTEATDANGKTSYYEYDNHGQLVKYINSLGNSIRFTRDSRGNVTQMTDFTDNVIKFIYNKANQIVSQTLPTGEVIQYGYDNAGNQNRIVYPDGTIISYSYDKADRIIGMTANNTSKANQRITYSYTYDNLDNLISWTDGSVTGSLNYDKDSLLTGETVNYGNNVTLRYGYTYTDAGYTKTLTYPDGTTVTYNYDNVGELDQLSIPNEGNISVDQFKWLAPSKITLPGGTTRTLSYDGILNPTTVISKSPNQQTLLALDNDYGKNSELLIQSINSDQYQYQYNSEQQLTQVNKNNRAIDSYILDANGNRISVSQVTGTITYDKSNRITQYGSTSFSYDTNGNLIKRTTGNQNTYYQYDLLNRLINVLDNAQSPVAAYTYDVWDNRLSKTQYQDGAGNRLPSPKVTYYQYSDTGLLAEADEQGNITVQYGFAPSDEWQTNPIFIKTAQGYAYYHNDHIGTPKIATNKQGDIVWQAEYQTDGKASLAADNQIVSNLRFAGQYFDAETGLHYNTRRYYDPNIGRYITQDPIGYDGGINLYNYVDSDPINAIDPTGEILPALALGYARCVLACGAIKAVTNAAGLCDNTSCLTDCLNPLNYLAVGQAYKSLKRTKKAGGCSFNSFTAETPVHTIDANGNPVLKAISELKVGDKVLAKSEWKAEGEDLSYESITDIISTPNAEQNWVHITLKGGDVLTATEGHPFSTPEGWRDAILLKKGGQLLLKGEDGDALTVQIEDVRTETKVLTTYNLEVANAHTYFVGKDAVLVHNCNYKRPKGFRKGVRDDAWESAREDSTKQVRDPVTGQFMSKNKPWDMGHKPGHEFKKHAKSAKDRGIDRKQFLNEHHKSDNYRPELPSSNRSHKGEAPDNVYHGP